MKYKGIKKIPSKHDSKNMKSRIPKNSPDYGKNKKRTDIRDEMEILFNLDVVFEMIEDLEAYIEELRNAFIERDLEQMEEIWKCISQTFRSIYSEVEQTEAYTTDDE